MSDGIEPFRVEIAESALEDLRARLRIARFPDAETVDGWVQGVPLAVMRRVRDYWLNHYDWRRCEAELNGFDQFRTEIDGLGLHFLHVRSPEPDARPLLINHGWPGSVLEFMKVIGPLSDPAAHGGDARDAFHLIIPSLPGYGFSDRPTRAGWTIERIAQVWLTLMTRLGYDRFLAQGGDWGAGIIPAVAVAAPERTVAIHVNISIAQPGPEDMDSLTEAERELLAQGQRHAAVGRGYSEIQGTRPQTLGYGLADSPIGQAAWIYEKFREWSDCGDDPESVFSLDELLDNITLYWLTNTGPSSGRLYWENRNRNRMLRVTSPVGISQFPKELFRSSRRFAERLYPDLIYWNELPRGGHFAAFEVPDLFVEEIRSCFRPFRI